jgi:N6-adenosine-specific RNA methylase IME4
MSLDDIAAIDIDQWAAKKCVLFLWACAPLLLEALYVMQIWRFEYKTCAVWDKVHRIGVGYWLRNAHEILLIGTRGKLSPPKRKFSSVFVERKTKHSRKPDCVRRAIEQMFPDAKRIELFARERHKGWDVWGNEAPTEYTPDQLELL